MNFQSVWELEWVLGLVIVVEVKTLQFSLDGPRI